MIGDTTHYFCKHNLRVQVSPFVYICLDTVYNYIMHRDIMYMYTINKLLLFTAYTGTPSVTWWTTTYSVSLHQSLTFVSLGMCHFASVPHGPVLIAQYSWFYCSTVFVFQPHNSFGGAPQHRPH